MRADEWTIVFRLADGTFWWATGVDSFCARTMGSLPTYGNFGVEILHLPFSHWWRRMSTWDHSE